MSEPGATRAFYDRWANVYDLLATAPGIRSWRARAVEALDLAAGETVVELGVGTGANLPVLKEAVGPGGRVIGVDLTRGMLAVAADRIATAGWDDVHLVQGDAETLPVAGPVDAVLGSFIVGLLDTPGEAVAAWLDAVGAGGRLAMLDAARSDRPLARPLNVGMRAFVRLTAPGGSVGRGSPIERLEACIRDADRALEAGTATVERNHLAGGFVRLRWGRVSPHAP